MSKRTPIFIIIASNYFAIQGVYKEQLRGIITAGFNANKQASELEDTEH